MSGKSKSQQKAQKPDRIRIQFESVKSDVNKWLGLKITLRQPDENELGKLMDKTKKPAEFFYTVDGSKFTVDVRVGSKVTVLGTADLNSSKDNPKGRETLVKLQANDLVSKAELEAWDKAHPDPKVIDGIKSEISRLEMDMRSDAADRGSINKFSSYDDGGRAAGYDVSALLVEWTKDKHKSWTHYMTFLDDVDKKGDPKAIFDTFMKDGAKLPINLPAKLLDPIEHAIANGTAPDFKAARALILKLVNTKFIPPFKKERVELYDKLLKENAVKLKALKKQLADAGGK